MFVIALLTLSLVPTAATPAADMVAAVVAPRIDGRLDDAVWQGKPRLGSFVLNDGAKPASAQTEVCITYDDRNLYLGVRAIEPNLKRLVTQASAAEASRVWNDDVLELFVDYNHDGYSYFHLGVTAAGIAAAQRGTTMSATDVDPGVTVATGRQADAWTLEIALPFSLIGAKPMAGEVWGLNVCRCRPQGPENSSWTGVQGSFCQAAEFGEIRFPSVSGLTLTNRGLAAPEGNTNHRNVFAGRYRATAAGALTIQVRSTALNTAAEQSVPLTAGEVAGFELPYQVAGEEGELLHLRVTLGNVPLYAKVLPVTRVTVPRVWQTAKPVYRELWGNDGPGMGAKGVIMWSHDIIDYEESVYCLKYAQPFVLEESYANAARRSFRYIMNGDLLPRNTFRARDYADKYGLKFILLGKHARPCRRRSFGRRSRLGHRPGQPGRVHQGDTGVPPGPLRQVCVGGHDRR